MAPLSAGSAQNVNRGCPVAAYLVVMLAQQFGQVRQHAGRGAPDVAVRPGIDVEMPLPPLEDAALALPVGGVAEKGEWHFEDGGDFAGIGMQFQWWRHQTDAGNDLIASPRDIGIEPTDQIDM